MWPHVPMASAKRRRPGLLLAAVALLIAVFSVNAAVAWLWPHHPAWWLAALAVFDVAGFVAIFILSHYALDPPNK